MKKKLLVFHPSLAPYRIDLFNALNEAFETNFYIFRKHQLSQRFDAEKLEAQFNFKPNFLTAGLELGYKHRMIRFGYLSKIVLHKPDLILCSEYNILTFSIALFTKVFFPKVKVYTLCDDSMEVAKNSSKSRRVGRFICLKILTGIILGNNAAEKWYNENFPKIKTITLPIIQKEERIVSILKDAENISTQYMDQYKLYDKNILLFVGRFIKVKNLQFLITVFSSYVLTNKNAVLVLVGDGDRKAELQTLVETLNMQDHILFVGRFENEELYAWYRIADYFILPSTSEAFGAVVNESLIVGVPVLCSDLAGASCLVNEKNGVTFNPYNEEKLLSILKEVLPGKRQKATKPVSSNSLMPYTFDQRISNLIWFLNLDAA
jgi:glycosyltransferase involved in cell wall biosynthesis